MQRQLCVKHVLELGRPKCSVSRACRVLGASRSGVYRQPVRGEKAAEVEGVILAASAAHPTLGGRKVTALIRREEGLKINHKRVERVRQRHGVRASRRGRKRHRLKREKMPRRQAQRADEVWSYDFISDATTDGRQVRVLSVIDEFTRECLSLEAARSYPSERVIDTLERLLVTTGRCPSHLRSDNGPEFVAKAVEKWLRAAKVQAAYIQPGAPWENGHVESFHASLRAELLDRELFYDLGEARAMLEDWREYYNHRRPHGALGLRAPLQAPTPSALKQEAPFQASATLRPSTTHPAGQTTP
jgi:transposase InsO family protein